MKICRMKVARWLFYLSVVIDTLFKLLTAWLVFQHRDDYLRYSQIWLGMSMMAILNIAALVGTAKGNRVWGFVFGTVQFCLLCPLLGSTIGANVAGAETNYRWLMIIAFWQLSTFAVSMAIAFEKTHWTDIVR